jgi:putative transposase
MHLTLNKEATKPAAGQAVGIKEVHDDIWLVSFMDYDLGYFDLETRVLEPLENPFGPKV